MFAYICVNMKLNTCNMSLIADYLDMNLKPQQKLNSEYKNKSQMVQGFFVIFNLTSSYSLYVKKYFQNIVQYISVHN